MLRLVRVAAVVTVVALWGGWACAPRGGVVSTSAPQNAHDPDVSWYAAPGPGGSLLPVGILRAPGAGPHPAVLLVTGSEGLNTDYVVFARELTEQGFDVAIGCWFDGGSPVDASDPRIPCERAPDFKGVTDGAVADLDALVAGARDALGGPAHLALVGFSRGGGIALLRATTGAPEPVVSIAGMVDGTTAWGEEPGEVDVIQRASGIVAPVLLLHGTADALVAVGQARAMEGALRALGADVAVKYYDGMPHGLAQIAWVRRDMEATITGFLCARFGCGAPGTAVDVG